MRHYSHGSARARLITVRLTGENSFDSWAKVVDCGDAPLTFLVRALCFTPRIFADCKQDNTAALKQLDAAHKVLSSSPMFVGIPHSRNLVTLYHVRCDGA